MTTNKNIVSEELSKAGIQRQSYFKKIFDIAEGQRVIKKTNGRCGRVVVMLIPL